MDVADWLRALGLERYEARFRENDVSAEILRELTAEDLEGLGVVSIGHRRQLLVAIAKLRDNAGSLQPVKSTIDDHLAPASAAERRPLSVMFCDLIGSTALSSRLDPEDFREIIRAYQACVATTIQQFDGFIARYVGDGVLIYFGWPQVRETDAERAVRAGLAVAAAVNASPVSGEPLQVRVGIATGLAVIGEPIGSGDARQQTAVGETPNLAARLQGLAGPNQVVIDAATRRQIGGLFECQDLGKVELKGLPVAVTTGRRFELARLLADRIVPPSPGKLHTATRAYTYRQKTQRAFAAEFLSPFEAVEAILHGDYSPEAQADAAEHFRVSDLTIRTLLVNHHRLEREELDEGLGAAA